jgi:D-beta-D-heptose 7-phosphate kinase/D-beta-D-heptose 1-phosphate adenosyltransferase
MTIVQFEELPLLRARFRDKKIIFCSGSFDLTHAGHVLFFEDCKSRGDILVVAVGGDRTIRDLKSSSRPILNESTRVKTVDSLKPVDYTLLDTLTTKEDEHAIFKKVFEKLKPDVYVINADVCDIDARRTLAQHYEVELQISQRECPADFENISTSKIIQKILAIKDTFK